MPNLTWTNPRHTTRHIVRGNPIRSDLMGTYKVPTLRTQTYMHACMHLFTVSKYHISAHTSHREPKCPMTTGHNLLRRTHNTIDNDDDDDDDEEVGVDDPQASPYGLTEEKTPGDHPRVRTASR